MSLVLGIDTSADVRVGVARDGHVLARRAVADTRQHVEQLVPLVREALAEAGAGVSDLGLICVGLGPGPFTGLRVGIAAAQTLAMVRRIPLHGVCSLDVVAAAAGRDDEFAVVTDARRKEVYWARYDADGQRRRGEHAVRRVDGPHVGPAEALPALPVIGPGATLYADRLGQRPRPSGPDAVDAGLLAALGRALPSAGEQPLYLRRPDAVAPTRRKSALVKPVRRRR